MSKEMWFVSTGDPSPIGPVVREAIERGLAMGLIPKAALVARAGDEQWLPILEVFVPAGASAGTGLIDEEVRTLFLERRGPPSSSKPRLMDEEEAPQRESRPGSVALRRAQPVSPPPPSVPKLGRLPTAPSLHHASGSANESQSLSSPLPAMHPEAHVGYQLGARDPEIKVATVRQLLTAFFDEALPEGALVELAPGQGFLPLPMFVRRYPHLVEEGTLGVQIMALLGALLLTGLAFLVTSLAGALQGLIFLAVLSGVLAVRHQPLWLGKSPRSLLRGLFAWKHHRPVLAAVGLLQALVVVSVVLHVRATGKATAALDQALASSDPCAVRQLDKDQVATFASPTQRQTIADREVSCREREQATARTLREEARCRRVAAAARSGAALEPGDVDASSQEFLRRLAQSTLVVADLRRQRSELPCADSLGPAFVERVQHAVTAWSSLQDATGLAPDLRDELITRKLDSPTAAALAKSAEEEARRGRKQSSVDELQKPLGLCALVDLVTQEQVPPACRELRVQWMAAQAREDEKRKRDEEQDAAKRRREEEQEEARRKVEEQRADLELRRAEREDAICEALQRKIEACHRRCDDLPVEVSQDVVERCSERCEQRLPARCQ